MDDWSFDTRAVQAGRADGPLIGPGPVPGPGSGAGPGSGPGDAPVNLGRPVAPGIQPSSSYAFARLQDLNRAFEDPASGYVYGRHGNPTVDQFAGAVATLEGMAGAVAFASGMGAIHAVLLAAGVGAGASVVAGRDLYGATQTLLSTIFASAGVRLRSVDATDTAAVRDAVQEWRPRVLFVETMSNPLLRLCDVPALGDIARATGTALVVDNTFASPYLYRPGAHGAAAVVHSATKYIGGHGDLIAGVVAAEASLIEPLRTVGRLVGGTLSPFDAWLALRGQRTLALRMARHCENAATVANHLFGHPRVSQVHYPGLVTHPQHALAVRLFGGLGFGGVVSFAIRDAGPAEVARFMDSLRLFTPAPSLGDVYSLALYPAQSSHRSLTAVQRADLGIGDGLVRLSVGIEAAEDLLADLDQALDL